MSEPNIRLKCPVCKEYHIFDFYGVTDRPHRNKLFQCRDCGVLVGEGCV